MKVALISHLFPPDIKGGGIGSYTFSLAEALSKKGIDVTVFCGGNIKEELKCNFKIKRLPMLNFPPRAVWFQLQNYKYLVKELKNFDIIHGQNTASTFYAFIKNKVKKPWIVTFHDCPTEELKIFFDAPFYAKNFGDFIYNVVEYPLYKKLYDLDLKYADKIIPVSFSLLDDLKKYSKFDTKKVKVIQNGINIENIRGIIKNTKKRDNKKIRLIFFGRLFYIKGLTFLIDAMKEVIRKNKNIILDIYGEGPLKKVLEMKIKKYKMGEYINLHNFLLNKEIIQEVCNSDIAILPSLYEAFGIAYLEVMACGKPLIAFDYSFARNIIQNGKTGILVKPKDSKELARAILKLVQDKKLRKKLGKNAYKTVKEQYDLAKEVNEYIKIYKEIQK